MKLLLIFGMMCIICGFPMLRNIKEYDGEIILYYDENYKINSAVEKYVKIYKEEIGNVMFKVGMTSKNIELVSAKIDNSVISCKKKDLYYECLYGGNGTDITLTAKNLTEIQESTTDVGSTQNNSEKTESEVTVSIPNFIESFDKVNNCTVQKDDNTNVSEGITFTVLVDGKEPSIKPQKINLISTTPQTYLSCEGNKCTLYNSEHTGNIIRYFDGKDYITCKGDNLSTGSQYENNHSTFIHIPSLLVSIFFLFTMI